VSIIDVPSRKLIKVVHLGDKAADFHGIFIPATQR
jgi:hypothetical protein